MRHARAVVQFHSGVCGWAAVRRWWHDYAAGAACHTGSPTPPHPFCLCGTIKPCLSLHCGLGGACAPTGAACTLHIYLQLCHYFLPSQCGVGGRRWWSMQIAPHAGRRTACAGRSAPATFVSVPGTFSVVI